MNDAVDKATRDYLLEQMLVEQRQTNQRLGRVETMYIEVLAMAQRGLAVEARVKRHARRITTLENVAYENGTPPKMEGPPERRRPIIPPAPDKEDSGIWEVPPNVSATLQNLEKFRMREERRESFMWKQRRTVLLGIAAAIVVALISAGGGFVGHRLSSVIFPPIPTRTP